MDTKLLTILILLISILYSERCDGQTTTETPGETRSSAVVLSTPSVVTTKLIFTTPVLSSMSGSGDGMTSVMNTTTTFTSDSTADLGSGNGTTGTFSGASTGTTFDVTTSDFGSGSRTDVTTISGDGSDTSISTAMETTSETGSGNSDTTVSSTTKFEVTTDVMNETTSFENETTVFEVTTGVVDTPATGLPWYIIVIICFGILILILLIAFIVFCCKCINLDKEPADDQKKTENVQTVKSEPLPTYVPQAPTVKPPLKKEEKVAKTFVSDTPMTPPAFRADSAVAHKREKVEPKEPQSSSFDDDEGFIEPLLRKERKPPKRVKKQPPKPEVQPEQASESGSELTERVPQFQQYYLPTPVQTALISKGLGNTLSDDALAARRALQRSDIERHRNKQRLRQRQRLEARHDAENYPLRTIDAVLAPPPPAALMSHEQRKKLRIKNARKSEIQDLTRETEGTYKQHSTDNESSDVSSEKTPPHEAVIAKMSKLLEQAYALLSPAVQNNLIQPSQVSSIGVPPLSSQTPIPVVPPPPPMQGYVLPQQQSSPMQPTERLFTKMHTPPTALMPPQQGTPRSGAAQPMKYHTLVPERANDANSSIWTPYRTYDQLEKLTADDPSFSIPSLHGSAAVSQPNSNIVFPNQPLSSTVTQPLNTVDMQYRPSSAVPVSAVPPPAQNSVPNFSNASTDDASVFGSETEQPASSIVQSIKDSLAKLARTATPVKEIESNC